MKNEIFWDVAPCRSRVNRRFGGKYSLKMEAISSSETSVHPTSTQRHIPEDDIFKKIYIYIYTISKAKIWSDGVTNSTVIQ
jgi:hypothetical protein